MTENDVSKGGAASRPQLSYAVAAAVVLGLIVAVLVAVPRLIGPSGPPIYVSVDGEPYLVPATRWHKFLEQALAAISVQSGSVQSALEQEIRDKVAEAFAVPKANITYAADWYYSLPGQVIRWGEPLGVDVLKRIAARVFPEPEWTELQAGLIADLSGSASARAQDANAAVLANLKSLLTRVEAPAVDSEPDIVLNSEFDADGFFQRLDAMDVLQHHGIAFGLSLGSVGAQQAAKLAAKRAAARVGGRGLSVACVTTGPAAPVCVAGMFAVTFVGSEYLLMRLEEQENRQEFEAALLAEVERLEKGMLDVLLESLRQAMDEQFESQREALNRKTRPRDLM